MYTCPNTCLGLLTSLMTFKLYFNKLRPLKRIDTFVLVAPDVSQNYRTDGSFAVNDVPSGSYVVEVDSPTFRFEPVRVDITSKGKMR